jgi:hypothetical protein
MAGVHVNCSGRVVSPQIFILLWVRPVH